MALLEKSPALRFSCEHVMHYVNHEDSVLWVRPASICNTC
jgi:hypothetical protein